MTQVAVGNDYRCEPLACFVIGVHGGWDRRNGGVARPQPEIRDRPRFVGSCSPRLGERRATLSLHARKMSALPTHPVA